MKALVGQTFRETSVRCAVCQTHSRPLYVPWHQHAVGCSVRASVLQQGFAQPLTVAGPWTAT